MSIWGNFSAGRNIAMKVPPHLYESSIQFYREVLGFKEITTHAPSVGFEFGSNNLWIDRVPGISQAEIWLEVITKSLTHSGAGIVHWLNSKAIRA